ncbi:unnamed protein product [Diatraea saccharalis]|uniref:N(4)-(beta-N-acetylglucosaminyl)-L-asparaginase n=1 Tax=Diatraea saccharalis TaxID=40085 RepID=A0A9N9R9C3_9NEOP|nr:unnamed protein product [Diatraea saccharalis]
MLKLIIFLITLFVSPLPGDPNIPIVVTTWNFSNATVGAWDILKNGGSSLDAIQKGASICQEQQCDGTVGYGGSPDEHGETTLDALLMDGKTMNVGAVGALRRIKDAVSVARHVLEHTKHSLLVGELATEFAVEMGFNEENLSSLESREMWKTWYNKNNCQPNFWMNVKPDPSKFCGPYRKQNNLLYGKPYQAMQVDHLNHDTIGIVAIDNYANVAAGTSTNGAKFKIPGRIGDSPIPGSGAYADNSVGGAAATGDGDIMLRFLPSFLAVEEMRRGAMPEEAARVAVNRIADHYPDFMGAVIALTKDGKHGAACHGIPTFPYIVQDNNRETYEIITIKCNH